MSSKPLVMSRACIRDTLQMKRLCPEKMTGLALSLYKLNIQELRRGQLAPHVEVKMFPNRFLEMQRQKRVAPDIVITVRGGMVQEVRSTNTDYAPGQEEFLYREACEVMAQLSKPTVTYTTTIQNLSCVSGYEQERFETGQLLRIWDEALTLNDQAYVSKLVER